ncbi:MAG: hypothetical protein FWD51_00585 [Betaproteobacteria bacterium]|nr:hypothetical protein [Betaproteobacteria bacterium]
MRKLSLLLFLSLIVGLTGCYPPFYPYTYTYIKGNEKLAHLTSEEVNQRVVKGKTTKKEILEWFGSPQETAVGSESGGVTWFGSPLSPLETAARSESGRMTEVWVYVFTKGFGVREASTKLKVTEHSKRLWFIFENNGIVSEFFLLSESNETKSQ